MKARKCGIFAHWLPNGNIRFFTGDERQGGVSEMQLINVRNPMATLTIAHVGKIIIEYEL
jgi:hypothetical protein